MNISIIGTGYVGLVSGVCFADFGFNVTCIDKDKDKIEGLKNGQIPIYEPGLEKILKKNIKAKRLSFSSDLNAVVKYSDIVFIAVGTPSRKGNGHADLSYVLNATEEISKAIDGYTLIVTKSTVPVGTGKKIYKIIH